MFVCLFIYADWLFTWNKNFIAKAKKNQCEDVQEKFNLLLGGCCEFWPWIFESFGKMLIAFHKFFLHGTMILLKNMKRKYWWIFSYFLLLLMKLWMKIIWRLALKRLLLVYWSIFVKLKIQRIFYNFTVVSQKNR